MVLIYVIAGVLILIGLVISYSFVYKSGKAKGILEASEKCDKKILFIKSELTKKIYGSVDNLNTGLNIKDKNVKINK